MCLIVGEPDILSDCSFVCFAVVMVGCDGL